MNNGIVIAAPQPPVVVEIGLVILAAEVQPSTDGETYRHSKCRAYSRR